MLLVWLMIFCATKAHAYKLLMDLRWLFLSTALVSIEGWFVLSQWIVFLSMHGIIIMFAAQFTVQPVSVVQAQGIDAVFECQYPGAQSYNWGINGGCPGIIW